MSHFGPKFSLLSPIRLITQAHFTLRVSRSGEYRYLEGALRVTARVRDTFGALRVTAHVRDRATNLLCSVRKPHVFLRPWSSKEVQTPTGARLTRKHKAIIN